jgi:hypothetical protein
MQTNTSVVKLSSLELSAVQFGEKDVISDIFEQAERSKKIRKALSLGSIFRVPVVIQVENASGLPLEIEAAVGAANDKEILLKSGVTIPVSSVKDILYLFFLPTLIM